MNQLYAYIGAINLGMIWGIMALGVYITYRILNIPDLTVDGSFATGGAICGVSVLSGISPISSICIAIIFGCLAGWITGILHTKCKIPAILSGILTQLSLYSINLRIMGGRANLPIIGVPTLFLEVSNYFNNRYLGALLISSIFMLFSILGIYLFFRTEIGYAVRATGCNERMATSIGINVSQCKLIGLILSNGLVAFSGALYSLYGQATDIRIGSGAMVIAFASIIIGEILIKKKNTNLLILLFSIILGSIIYRIIVLISLEIGMNTDDLKLVTALIVVISLTISNTYSKRFSN